MANRNLLSSFMFPPLQPPPQLRLHQTSAAPPPPSSSSSFDMMNMMSNNANSTQQQQQQTCVLPPFSSTLMKVRQNLNNYATTPLFMKPGSVVACASPAFSSSHSSNSNMGPSVSTPLARFLSTQAAAAAPFVTASVTNTATNTNTRPVAPTTAAVVTEAATNVIPYPITISTPAGGDNLAAQTFGGTVPKNTTLPPPQASAAAPASSAIRVVSPSAMARIGLRRKNKQQPTTLSRQAKACGAPAADATSTLVNNQQMNSKNGTISNSKPGGACNSGCMSEFSGSSASESNKLHHHHHHAKNGNRSRLNSSYAAAAAAKDNFDDGVFDMTSDSLSSIAVLNSNSNKSNVTVTSATNTCDSGYSTSQVPSSSSTQHATGGDESRHALMYALRSALESMNHRGDKNSKLKQPPRARRRVAAKKPSASEKSAGLKPTTPVAPSLSSSSSSPPRRSKRAPQHNKLYDNDFITDNASMSSAIQKYSTSSSTSPAVTTTNTSSPKTDTNTTKPVEKLFPSKQEEKKAFISTPPAVLIESGQRKRKPKQQSVTTTPISEQTTTTTTLTNEKKIKQSVSDAVRIDAIDSDAANSIVPQSLLNYAAIFSPATPATPATPMTPIADTDAATDAATAADEEENSAPLNLVKEKISPASVAVTKKKKNAAIVSNKKSNKFIKKNKSTKQSASTPEPARFQFSPSPPYLDPPALSKSKKVSSPVQKPSSRVYKKKKRLIDEDSDVDYVDDANLKNGAIVEDEAQVATNVLHNISRAANTARERQYGCEECGKLYSTLSNLTRHRRVHEDESALSCEFCGKKYMSPAALTMHVQSHVKRFQCRYCLKRFSRNWLLHNHLRLHTGEKPYNCPVAACGKTFADRSNYRTHLMAAHASKAMSKSRRGSKARGGHDNGTEKIYTNGIGQHVCPGCQRAFSLKTYLLKHVRKWCKPVLNYTGADADNSLKKPTTPMDDGEKNVEKSSNDDQEQQQQKE